jgi:hypothetical protein
MAGSVDIRMRTSDGLKNILQAPLWSGGWKDQSVVYPFPAICFCQNSTVVFALNRWLLGRFSDLTRMKKNYRRYSCRFSHAVYSNHQSESCLHPFTSIMSTCFELWTLSIRGYLKWSLAAFQLITDNVYTTGRKTKKINYTAFLLTRILQVYFNIKLEEPLKNVKTSSCSFSDLDLWLKSPKNGMQAL